MAISDIASSWIRQTKGYAMGENRVPIHMSISFVSRTYTFREHLITESVYVRYAFVSCGPNIIELPLAYVSVGDTQMCPIMIMMMIVISPGYYM